MDLVVIYARVLGARRLPLQRPHPARGSPNPPRFLVLLLANLGVSLWMILSPTTRTAVTKPVQHPPGLSRWMDVYASADPVPNGPTRIERDARGSDVRASLESWRAPVRPYDLLGKSRRFRAAGRADMRRDGGESLARQAAACNAGWLAGSARHGGSVSCGGRCGQQGALGLYCTCLAATRGPRAGTISSLLVPGRGGRWLHDSPCSRLS